MSVFLQQPLLSLIVFLGASFTFSLLLPSSRPEVIRLFSLVVSLIALLLGVLACLSFNQSAGFQFLYRVDILPEYNLGFTLGADGISMIFLLLTLFVFPVCFLTA
jgi:NADH-quinone oxidoreductase subunit M